MRRVIVCLTICFLLATHAAYAKDNYEKNNSLILLPELEKKGGMPLMQALNKRCTGRDFAKRPLPRKVLSRLLWSACGVNRKESGKQTAPSSHLLREIEVYVVTKSGSFRYIPKKHALEKCRDVNMQEAVAELPYVRNAPLNLIYVSDFTKFGPPDVDPKRKALKKQISSTHCGFIGQNVYLFCASEGLNCVFHGWMDAGKIHEMLHLNSRKHVLFGQAVGYGEIGEE